MQFHRVNNKEHQHFLVVSLFFAYAHASEFHVLFIWGVLVFVLNANLQHCEERQLMGWAVFPTPSLPLPLFIQCDGCLFPFPVWGLMAEFPGFASHGRSLHQGAGCQYWKLQNVSGTQTPLSGAVVNLLFWGLFFYFNPETYFSKQFSNLNA